MMGALAFVVGIPVLGAAAIGLVGRAPSVAHHEGVDRTRRMARFRGIALGTSIVTLCAVVFSSLAGSILPASLSVGIDGLSGGFMLLTAAAWVPIVFAARQSEHKRPGFLYGLLLLLEAAYLAFFATDDAVFLCASLESSTLILYLLIGGWGGRERDRVAQKFLLFNLAGGMLILIGLLGLAVSDARMAATGAESTHGLTLSIRSLLREIPRLATDDAGAQEYWSHAQPWILASLIVGLAIKTPLVPFHAWFTAAVSEAPLSAGLALLGAGLHLSTYAFVRIVAPFAGEWGAGGDLVIALAVLGALHQSLLALAHDDVRKMTACASLSQASLAVAGLFSLQFVGAALFSVGAGLASVLLLFAFGCLEMRFDTRELSALGGIGRPLPQTSAVAVVAALSLVGLPGLSCFAGLYATLGGIFDAGWLSAFGAMIASLIVAWAMFWMLQRLVFGVTRLPQPGQAANEPSDAVFSISAVWNRAEFSALRIDENSAQAASMNDRPPEAWPKDLSRVELLVIVPLVAAMVVVGLWPQLVVKWIQAAVHVVTVAS